MSDRAASEVRDVLRGVTIKSPTEYELGGATFRVSAFAPPAFAGHMHGAAYAPPLAPLANDLQERLYEFAYVRAMNGRIEQPPMPHMPQPLFDELSAANATRERWDGGWQLVQPGPNGQMFARKGATTRAFPPGRYAFAQGSTPAPGAWMNVFLAKESRDMQPGFYHVFGELPMDDSNAGRLTRLYFNVDQQGAAPLVHAITTHLNRLTVPFRMKTLAYRDVYTRSDAAVLFFDKRYFPIVARLLGRIRTAVRDHLRPRTPLMTRRLHDGIGLAEDPATHDSFGTSRCRLIAQAIWDAYQRGMQSEEARMQELEMQFARNGLVLAKPWLRAGSADTYELPEDDA